MGKVKINYSLLDDLKAFILSKKTLIGNYIYNTEDDFIKSFYQSEFITGNSELNQELQDQMIDILLGYDTADGEINFNDSNDASLMIFNNIEDIDKFLFHINAQLWVCEGEECTALI